MRRRLLWASVLVTVVAGGAAVVTRGLGFTARAVPWPLEESLMRGARRWAIPAAVRRQANPVAPTTETLRAGLEHWADHCATCHANDGSGETSMGRGLYPSAPDMRGVRSQSMSDGELFYVIEQGIPFTGMPAWGTGTPDGERSSWELVRFIRHLPRISDAELRDMEALNPKSSADARHKADIDEFLSGGTAPVR